MKLSQWAKNKNLSYQTAWNLFKSGKLPVKSTQLKTGTILVEDEFKLNKEERCVTYSRVSNHSRKDELNLQVDRCSKFCEARGLTINGSYKEIASGMNENRKVLWGMIESMPTKLIVENKDRLTRFGFSYLSSLLKERGCEIIVINESENDQADLLKDLASVIYSFCARLYGLRRAKNKSQKCLAVIENIND